MSRSRLAIQNFVASRRRKSVWDVQPRITWHCTDCSKVAVHNFGALSSMHQSETPVTDFTVATLDNPLHQHKKKVQVMSYDMKEGSSMELPRLDMTGRTLKRRPQTANAKHPYDAARSFSEPDAPMELFRRRREESDPKLPRETEKRVKFEIIDDVPEGQADRAGGYNPYGHNK